MAAFKGNKDTRLRITIYSRFVDVARVFVQLWELFTTVLALSGTKGTSSAVSSGWKKWVPMLHGLGVPPSHLRRQRRGNTAKERQHDASMQGMEVRSTDQVSQVSMYAFLLICAHVGFWVRTQRLRADVHISFFS